jgi:hypothetical protein
MINQAKLKTYRCELFWKFGVLVPEGTSSRIGHSKMPITSGRMQKSQKGASYSNTTLLLTKEKVV